MLLLLLLLLLLDVHRVHLVHLRKLRVETTSSLVGAHTTEIHHRIRAVHTHVSHSASTHAHIPHRVLVLLELLLLHIPHHQLL